MGQFILPLSEHPKLLELAKQLKVHVPQLPLQSVAPQELALAQTQLRKPSTILPPPSPEPPLIPEDHVIQPKLLALLLKMPVPQLPLQPVAQQELALAQTQLRTPSTEPPLIPEDHVIQPKLSALSLKLPVIHPSLSDAPTELPSADLLLRPKLTLMPLPSPEIKLTPEDHAIPAKQPHTDY